MTSTTAKPDSLQPEAETSWAGPLKGPASRRHQFGGHAKPKLKSRQSGGGICWVPSEPSTPALRPARPTIQRGWSPMSRAAQIKHLDQLSPTSSSPRNLGRGRVGVETISLNPQSSGRSTAVPAAAATLRSAAADDGRAAGARRMFSCLATLSIFSAVEWLTLPRPLRTRSTVATPTPASARCPEGGLGRPRRR